MAKEKKCPLLGKACIEDGCKFWVHVRGANPQTGAEMDLWDCSIAWLPVLLIENAQVQRQTGAAVESMRNEQVKSALGVVDAMQKSLPAHRHPEPMACPGAFWESTPGYSAVAVCSRCKLPASAHTQPFYVDGRTV